MPDDDRLQLDLVSRRNRELEAMIAVAGLSVRNAPLAEIEQEAVVQVEKLLSADSVALCLATDDGKSLTLAAGTGMSEATRKKAGEIRFGLLWKVFQSGVPLVDNDLPSREGVRRDLMEGGVTVHSTIAAPLTARGRVVGTLSACSYRPRTFLPEDATLLSTVGAQLAAVIENARLREELLSQKDLTEILLAAATAFGRATSLDELKEAMLEALQHATGEETVAILAFDEERDVGWIAAISNVPAAALPMLRGRMWGPGNAAFTRLRTARAPVVLSAGEIQEIDREAWESTRPAGLLLVPLFRQQSFFGAVSVNLSRDSAPDARMMSLVEGVAALGAASMSNLELWGLTERRAALSASLLRTAHELAGERDPEAILRIATRQARTQLQSQGALAVSDTPEGMRVEATDGECGLPPGPAPGSAGLLAA
ncbi:MAG: GAF domain-containing protein, partial [Candidatus Brocadiae bacterium]|nr:GAF domain-containing protein [Candidatus Brocadiia bacterium]